MCFLLSQNLHAPLSVLISFTYAISAAWELVYFSSNLRFSASNILDKFLQCSSMANFLPPTYAGEKMKRCRSASHLLTVPPALAKRWLPVSYHAVLQLALLVQRIKWEGFPIALAAFWELPCFHCKCYRSSVNIFMCNIDLIIPLFWKCIKLTRRKINIDVNLQMLVAFPSLIL